MASHPKKSFQSRLAVARSSAGLTQRALGEKLGVRQASVSQWEMGVSVPDPKMVYALETVLDLPAGTLSDTITCSLCGQDYRRAEASGEKEGLVLRAEADYRSAILTIPELADRFKLSLIAVIDQAIANSRRPRPARLSKKR